MKFTDSKDQAAEIVRLLLPFLAKHHLAAHPVNYTVAYEYFTGRSQELKDAIDKRIDSGSALDEETMAELFKRFFAEEDAERLEKLRHDLGEIMNRVLPTITEAGAGAAEFGKTLESHLGDLKDDASPEAVETIVGDLINATEEVGKSNRMLHTNLQAAEKESETLRTELEQAKKEATIDALTGLYNRKTLEKRMDELVADTEEVSGFCVLMIDIDHFKKVNDTYGHLVGDEVIRRVSRILKDCIRGSDFAARYGGEEFTLLLPNTPMRGAITVANSIRTKMEAMRLKKKNSEETLDPITVSGGVADYKRGESTEAVLERADKALYLSKENGRNRVSTENELH